jgi:ankyrin repeat protein
MSAQFVCSTCLQAKQQAAAAESQCSFEDLPAHVQAQVFAHAGAPLLTCRASAAVAKDPSLVANWLIRRRRYPLKCAAHHKLWDVCKLLLVHPQLTNNERDLSEALECAAAGGSAEVVQLLLQQADQYLDEYVLSSAYDSAFKHACANGHAPVCQVLTAQPYLTWHPVRLGLVKAAKHGQLEVLQLLRDRCLGPNAAAPEPPRYVYGLDERGRLQSSSSKDLQNSWYVLVEEGLVAAAKAGQLEALSWFLGQGADVLQAGKTLVDAGMAGQLPAMRLLWGWHEEVRKWAGKALEMSIGWAQVESVKFLLKEGGAAYDVCLLGDAAGMRNPAIIAAVLEAWSGHVTAKDLSFALTLAIMNDSVEGTKLLMKAGAQVNLDDKDDLLNATHPELLELLRQHGIQKDSALDEPHLPGYKQ